MENDVLSQRHSAGHAVADKHVFVEQMRFCRPHLK